MWSCTAPRGELRRLRRFHENLEYEWDQRPRDAVNNAPDFPSITAVIDPKTREDFEMVSRETWERIVRRTDQEVFEREFVKGFVEGALGIEATAEDLAEDATED